MASKDPEAVARAKQAKLVWRRANRDMIRARSLTPRVKLLNKLTRIRREEKMSDEQHAAIREYSRAYSAEWRKRNPGYYKEWRAKHPGYWKSYRKPKRQEAAE